MVDRKNYSISVCIPCYDMHGRGSEYLRENLYSLINQKFRNFDVVVSDQTQNNLMRRVVRDFREYLNICYIDSSDTTGASENFNCAIQSGVGDIVKILCQDDIMIDPNGLQLISDAFQKDNCGWVVGGCLHFKEIGSFFNDFIPFYNDEIIIGKNTLSSPSNLAFLRTNDALFDRNLDNFLDVDFYYQLNEMYSLPVVIQKSLIANRIHAAQLSNKISKKIIRQEFRYVLSKYPFLYTELGYYPIVKQYLRYVFLK